MTFPQLLPKLLAGELPWFEQSEAGTLRTGIHAPRAILAGSFNPLHRGHLELAAVARQRLGLPVHFEISITNVDKQPLPGAEIERRLRQFQGVGPVVATLAPTFARKAALFPGATFILGADTAARVIQSKYYPSESAMFDALHGIRDLGCRFLVGGRLDPDATFVELDGVRIPESVRDLFEGIPEAHFRVDLSSTELRGAVCRSN
jgi:Cytidylyltransferase-like